MKVEVLDKPFFNHVDCRLYQPGDVLEFEGKCSSNLRPVADSKPTSHELQARGPVVLGPKGHGRA